LKKYKPWFNEGCSKLVGERKHAKLQWLQDPSEINGDNMNNVRCGASRYFRNKKREYLKDKINELQQTVRTSETCVEEYMNLRWATNQEITSLIYSFIHSFIYLQVKKFIISYKTQDIDKSPIQHVKRNRHEYILKLNAV
jgi:hypothetical protein